MSKCASADEGRAPLSLAIMRCSFTVTATVLLAGAPHRITGTAHRHVNGPCILPPAMAWTSMPIPSSRGNRVGFNYHDHLKKW